MYCPVRLQIVFVLDQERNDRLLSPKKHSRHRSAAGIQTICLCPTEQTQPLSMRYRAVISVAMLALCAPAGHPIDPGPVTEPNTFIVEYDSSLTQAFTESEIPGLAVAIVQEGKIVYMKGFGRRRVGEEGQIDVNSVFRISSLSKGFASVLAGILVKQGLLHWDDRVENLLPGFALKDSTNTRDLTVRHVLGHTSGLTSHTYDNLIEANVRFEEITRKLREAPVLYPVGKYYTYQNVVYGLIGPIIKTVTGNDYDVELSRRLLTPLGMHQTSVGREGLLHSRNFAFPHIRKKGKWTPYPIKEAYYQVQPAAGINASVHDMALWLCALTGGKPDIVPPDVIDQVTRPQVETPREIRRFHLRGQVQSAYYGMGWRIFDCGGHTVIFHGGGVKGYLAQLAFLPKERMGVVVLQNSWAHSPFLFEFLDIYFSRTHD
jgi:beta-lactamase class C